MVIKEPSSKRNAERLVLKKKKKMLFYFIITLIYMQILNAIIKLYAR